MSIHSPNPQQANIEDLLEMIREIGGTAEAFTAEDATRLALKLQALQAQLATHTIIIGVVPTSSSAST